MSVKKLLGAAAWKGLLLAVVTLLLLLAAAALMLQRGLVGESAASALVCAAYAAAVMIGGRSAIRGSSAPPLPQSWMKRQMFHQVRRCPRAWRWRCACTQWCGWWPSAARQILPHTARC